jgi:hypothetical protein
VVGSVSMQVTMAVLSQVDHARECGDNNMVCYFPFFDQLFRFGRHSTCDPPMITESVLSDRIHF